MRLNLPVTYIERPIPEGEVLVSRTDLKGVITYCNRTFCEVSGYSDSELLGSPHNLIRHPDMPAEIFADCWQTLLSGQSWNGVVKNRCKNGDFYWVDANISPWLVNGAMTGFVSLRYKAGGEQIAAAEKYYRALRNGEAVVKPFSACSQRRVVDLQQQLAERIIALEQYRDNCEEESRLGRNIMRSINNMGGVLDPLVQHRIVPSANYGGDMILAARTPEDVLHLMLADVVGHGLTAAMNAMPISQIFYAMTRKSFDIAHIVEELNLKIRKIMPPGHYVAATLVSVDLLNEAIEVWNGGNPEVALLNANGDMLRKWPSDNFPLGIVGGQDFSSKTEVFHYREDCQLFLFSDGLVEAASSEGKQFGCQRIEALLQQTLPEQRFDHLFGGVERHLSGQAVQDDMAAAQVTIALQENTDEIGQVHPDSGIRQERGLELDQVGDWRFAISLGAAELKYLDVIPLLTQFISQVRGVRGYYSVLLLILSELFNNALDHGLLRLDSGIKHGTDGFEKFLLLREERLLALDSGTIDIEIEKATIEGKPAVKIRVADSGDGFDYAAVLEGAGNQADTAQHGRGLSLVKGLAHKLEFSPRGNEAVAYYVRG